MVSGKNRIYNDVAEVVSSIPTVGRKIFFSIYRHSRFIISLPIYIIGIYF